MELINQKGPLSIAIVLIIVGILAAVGFGYHFYTTTTTTTYAGKIVIGTETWPGYFPLYVAEERGYFREEGLDVDVKRYVALGEVSRDYQAGKLQGRANLTLDAVSEALDGLDHRVILAIDYSNGSDAIVARQGIKNISDLKGKRVAYEAGTLEEFFVAWALSEYKMSLADIVPVLGNPEESVTNLVEGRADAAVSHEPFLSQLITQNSGIHTVYSSADALGLITDILTFRSDFIEAYPETIPKIIRAYFKAMRFWRDNPEESNAIMAKEFGDTKESIAEQLKGITMLNERDNKTAFTFTQGLDSLYGNMKKTNEFIVEHRRDEQQKEIDTDELIEPRFLRIVLKGK